MLLNKGGSCSEEIPWLGLPIQRTHCGVELPPIPNTFARPYPAILLLAQRAITLFLCPIGTREMMNPDREAHHGTWLRCLLAALYRSLCFHGIMYCVFLSSSFSDHEWLTERLRANFAHPCSCANEISGHYPTADSGLRSCASLFQLPWRWMDS